MIKNLLLAILLPAPSLLLACSLPAPKLLLGLLNSMARVWQRAVISMPTSRNLVEDEP